MPIGTPVKLAAALGVALLLGQKRRGPGLLPRRLLRAVADRRQRLASRIVWRAIFSDAPIVDRTQKLFGHRRRRLDRRPGVIIYALVALTVWQFGAPMVIFLAGLKQVPRELYEAAEVDGAGAWRRFCTSPCR